MSKRIQSALICCAVINLAVVVWDLSTGGIYFTVFGITFSSWEVGKPIRYAAACSALALWLHDRTATRPSWDNMMRWAARAAAAIAIASIVIAALCGVQAAGGADAYGYVSEAKLWIDRTLIVDDPLAALAPDLGMAVAPVGYTLSKSGSGIAPVYPPGLPLTMAFARLAAGPRAVYLVVPVLAGLTVWMTFLIGTRVADERTGLVAAILLAFNPLFLFQSFEPMSDVPATAWWAASWAMSLAPGPWSAFGAGVAACAAIVTRPNLAPLALLIAASSTGSSPRARRFLLFALPVAIGCLLVAAFNFALHGSPFVSGYGLTAALFSRTNLTANLKAYSGWMRDLCCTVLLLAVAAPWLRKDVSTRWMLVFSIGVVLSYLFYLVFDTWPFARFMLPALPLLFVLTTIVMLHAIGRLPPRLRGVSLLVVSTLLATRDVDVASRLHIFNIRDAEQRYATIGEYVGRTVPSRSVVFATVHSGSLRLYGDRLTVRWNSLAPDGLDPAIALVQKQGYVPYFLLEDWEEPEFRAHFAEANMFGKLDWPAALEYPWAGHARLYLLDDRARHFAGEHLVTRAMPTRGSGSTK